MVTPLSGTKDSSPTDDSPKPSTPAGSTSKKRKRTPKKKTPSVSASTTGNESLPGNTVEATTTVATTLKVSQAPVNILVLDNGGDIIKYGWHRAGERPDTDALSQVKHIPNVTARLQQQWTVLAGDQLTQVNQNQLVGVTRSTERGVIVNMGNQIQVWKRLLDLSNVTIPLHTETAKAFGWKKAVGTSKKAKSILEANSEQPKDTIPATTCAVLIALPPFYPRAVLDQIASVWFEDFGFSHVGFCNAQLCARQPSPYGTCCVVDLGWSATHIVPTFMKQALVDAIRTMPVAGRHLINMWKYFVSYRQWNLMDQEWILREVLHQTGYVSLKFEEELKLARKLPPGIRPYDREFVLPDFNKTFEPYAQLPPALKREQSKVQTKDDDDDEEDEDENDEDFDEKDAVEEDVDEDEDEDGGSGSDDEERPEEKRRRLLREREAEERRRREMEEQQQVLQLSVERFTVPETLFRPTDAGLPSEWPGLPRAIVQSIEAAPKDFQAALYRSIYLVGGLSVLPGLEERLYRELRIIAPCEFDVDITMSKNPVDQAWLGALRVSQTESLHVWSVSRDVWASAARGELWANMELTKGGHLI